MKTQMDQLYQETYIRAYRMRHPRGRIKILSAIISVVIVLATITATWGMGDILYGDQAGSIVSAYSGTDDTILDTPMTTILDVNVLEQDVPPAEIEPAEETIQKVTYLASGERTTLDPTVVTQSNYDFEEVYDEVSDAEYLSEDIPDSEEETSISANGPPQEEGEIIPLQSSGSWEPTAEELEFIERVVEAEVTGTSFRYDGKDVTEEEMLLSKIRVAQVFLNRAYDTTRFSHITTLYEAVSEPGASSTVASGRCYRVEVTDLTREAVQRALDPNQEDLTDGALFFLAGGATHCKYGDYLFTDAVGHSFFK